jgi:hypothetical protein
MLAGKPAKMNASHLGESSSVKVDISTRVDKPSCVLRQNLSEGLLFLTLLGIPHIDLFWHMRCTESLSHI